MRAFLRSPKVAALLAVVLFLAANIMFAEGLGRYRIDLTEDKLFTISEGTEKILRNLEEPIVVTFFFSESVARDYPDLFLYGRRIRDMLKEYRAIAGDRLRLEIVEPEPFSEEEDRAVAAGLQGIPTASGEQIYLGLVARDLTNREASIPFFSLERQDFLEYDLTKLIAGLATDERPRVALVTSLPMAPGGFAGLGQPPGRGWVIHDQLQQLFEVETLSVPFKAVPADTDLLLLVHPPGLSDDELYAIDQYVLAGGHAAVFLDPFSEAAANARRGMAPPAPESSTLDPLLKAWGLEMVPGKIVADIAQAQRVNMGGGGPRAIKDFVLWIAARDDAINRDDPVTGNLEQINLASAGALEPVAGATTTIEPLVRSSAVSALVDASEARGLPDPDALLRRVVPDENRYTLIARVTGAVKSAYPDGPPKKAATDAETDAEADADTTPQHPHLAASKEPVALIVGADSDLFDDRFWAQVQDFFGQRVIVPIADNATLLINALDNLAGSDELIALRGRGVRDRPFTVVAAIRRAAEARFLAEQERLKQELATTEQRLRDLQSKMGEGEVVLSPEQEEEMARFRTRALEIRRQLRAVQRNLVHDIEALGTTLAVVNIALVPALLTLVALVLAAWRRRRRKRRMPV